MADSKPDPAPAAPDFTQCPDWGKGGRYIYDPATGTRTPVMDEPAESAEPATTTPTKKGK